MPDKILKRQWPGIRTLLVHALYWCTHSTGARTLLVYALYSVYAL
jgi:hypothetical protein